MSSASSSPPAIPTQYHTIPSFTLSNGTTQAVRIAYTSQNAHLPRTVLIPTCFGGTIAEECLFNVRVLSGYHIITIAAFGNGESASPSNDPAFPRDHATYQDCVNAGYLLLTQVLGVRQLHAVIGFSMGAQQAYYWAVMHGASVSASAAPKVDTETPFLKSAIMLCGSARTSGHNYAFLEGPIAALTESVDYVEGAYRKPAPPSSTSPPTSTTTTLPTRGLRAFGRAYAAWLTSPEWFHQRLWTKWGAASLQDWLHPAPGRAPFEAWHPDDLLCMARMWQAGDVGVLVGGGDGESHEGGSPAWQTALRSIAVPVLLMPCESDQYFPARDAERELTFLARGELAVIPSVWGHTAGGGADVDILPWMDDKVRAFLEKV